MCVQYVGARAWTGERNLDEGFGTFGSTGNSTVMPVWRNARQRRLYGKPDDPIDPGPSSGMRSGGGHSPNSGSPAPAAPPPAPKRVKREKTRPESEYELVHGLPVTEGEPDYSLLTHPIDPKPTSSVVAYAIYASRQNWLAGPMFETFWTRKPKGKKAAPEGNANLREKMTKLHECTVTLGPHNFPVKLFTVRDDNVFVDEEADKKVEEILEAERKKNEPPKQEPEPTEPASNGEPVSNEEPGEEPKEIKEPQAEGFVADDVSKEESNEPKQGDQDSKEDTIEESKEEPKESKEQVRQKITDKSQDSDGLRPTDSQEVENKVPAKKAPKKRTRKNEAKPEEAKDTGKVEEDKSETQPPKKKRTRKTKKSEAPAPDNQDFNDEKVNIEEQKRKNEALEQKLKSENTPSRSPSQQAPLTGPSSSTPNPSSQPPPEAERAPPPNQLVVYRLQQMAAQDPSLSELMRLVASGSADPASIAKFQDVINQVKASVASSQLTVQTKEGSPKKGSKNPRPQVVFQPRPSSKAIMLAIEFDESPFERYLLPKRSIIEFIPEKDEVLWSFLHVYNPNESESKPAKKDQQPVYTPVTAVFHQVPVRIAQTLERCVRKPEVVRYYMEETMRNADRAQPWNLWFRIEKNDEVLADLIRKMPIPMMPPPAIPKKPMKQRKQRAPTVHQIQQQQFMQQQQQFHMYMMWLAKVKQGQPLPVPPMMAQRRAEPLIQPPSFLMRPMMGMPLMRPVYGPPGAVMAPGPMTPGPMTPGSMTPAMIPGPMGPTVSPPQHFGAPLVNPPLHSGSPGPDDEPVKSEL